LTAWKFVFKHWRRNSSCLSVFSQTISIICLQF
jgi:hypothetical protein